MTDIDKKSQLTILNSLILDSDELEELSDRLSSFNVFDVLGVANYEIRHSNMLAWLFNPSEPHGFSDKFLRRFLVKVLCDEDNSESGIQPASIEVKNFEVRALL